MGEARSLTYSINVEANTAQAESNVRNLTSSLGSLQNGGARLNIEADTSRAESNIRSVTGNLGGLQSQVSSVGSAFRSSFLEGVDTGQSLSSSLKSGVGGALSYVGSRATEFKDNFVQGAENIKNSFTHPIETIKNGLGNAVQNAKDKFIDMVRGAEQAADGADDMGDAAQDAGKDIQDLGNEADSAGGKFEKLGGMAKTAGLALVAALGVAVGAVGAFGVSAVNTGMEFDSAMSQVSATMGMTTADIAGNVNGAGDTFNALRDKAKEMGAATNFSATQAAEGLNILAMSGFDATSSMNLIEDVLHLAAAGGMEMAESADYIAGSMKGFNDSTKDSAYYADLMAKGATLANTSVAELGQAMSGGAATAASYGQSADGMTLALLRLAEQGEVGSAASTALNAAMKDLYTPSEQAKKALTELGISVYDQSGKARDMNTVINELNGALSGMSDEEANAYKSTIFQIQGLQAFNKMTVTSTEKQEEWAAALAGASGEASRQYDTMTDNLQGDIDIWNSALDGFKIALSDELTPTIREFVQFGSDSMGKLTEAFEAGGLSGAMGALGEILSDGLGMVVDMLPSLVDAGMQLIGALGKGIMDNLPTVITAAAQIIVTLATGIGDALPTLIPAVVDTLLLVVSTLIENLPLILDAGMQLLNGLAEGITNAIPQLIEGLPLIIDGILGFLTESLPVILEQGVQILMSLVTGIIDSIPLLVEQLPLVLESITGFITENLPVILEQGVQMITNLAMGIVDSIPQLVEQLPILIDSIVGFLVENMPAILEQGIQMITNLAVGILEALPSLIEQLPAIITGFVGCITENLPLIIETGINLLIQFAGGIIQAIPQLVEQLPAIISAIVSGLGSMLGQIADVGKNIVEGLWNGISGMASWVMDKVKGFASGIVDGIKGLLGIHSPSTVFADIGDNMALGLGKGFESTIGGVTKDIEGSIPTKLDGPEIEVPDPDIPKIDPDSSGMPTGDVSYGVNPVIGEFNPPDGIGVTDVQMPQVSDISYGVKPIVEEVNTPAVSDVSYGVNPVIGEFNPPDASASAVYSNEAADNKNNGNSTSETSSPAPFAPVITIEVKGDVDEKTVENMSSKLRDTVKELFEEFREQELERMALKNQYAF